MSEVLKLAPKQDAHVQQVIATLRELLAHAEAGEIVALTGIAEYRTEYREVHTGCRNVYSMAGAHFAAASKLVNG